MLFSFLLFFFPSAFPIHYFLSATPTCAFCRLIQSIRDTATPHVVINLLSTNISPLLHACNKSKSYSKRETGYV